MKKLIILLSFILFIFSCSREAAEKLKNASDDYYSSSISALSQVETVYLKFLPADKEGNIDKSLKYDVTNHFNKIAAAYKSYKDIFDRLETGYYLAAPTVKKSKAVLEKLIKQQIYFYQLLDQSSSTNIMDSDIEEGFLDSPSTTLRTTARAIGDERNEEILEEDLSAEARRLLYTALLKGSLVLELVENYNKFDASILSNIISDYKIRLNNPDFNENINIIVDKIGGKYE
ncbi:MAG: hypothetical protein KA885_09925 [Spirochaetes bacterium]|nr:hypothetical protein [Spirochaetota bacterium]